MLGVATKVMMINMIVTKRVGIAAAVEAVVTMNAPRESQVAAGGVEKIEGQDPRAEDHQGSTLMNRKVAMYR